MGQSKPRATAQQARCPICREPMDADFQPFCSKRCADIDLARWLGGTYVIAGGQEDADEDGDDAQASRGQPAQQKDEPHEDE